MSAAFEIQQEIALLEGLLSQLEEADAKIGVELRIEGLKEELSTLLPSGQLFHEIPTSAHRSAVFVTGEKMTTNGIPAELASEVLSRYNRMFAAQALRDERTARKVEGHSRRRRGTPSPALWLKATPRGSFGFELASEATEVEQIKIHELSLKNVARAIHDVANPDVELLEICERHPRAVMDQMKALLKILVSHDVGLRLVFDDSPSLTVSADNVRFASARMELKVDIQEFKLIGRPRGATMDTGHFDFMRDDDGTVIKGWLDDQIDDEQRQRFNELSNKLATATIECTTITTATGRTLKSFILKDLRPLAAKFEGPEYTNPFGHESGHIFATSSGAATAIKFIQEEMRREGPHVVQLLANLREIAVEGISPDGTRISPKHQATLLAHIDKALAIFQDNRSIEFDRQHALTAMLAELSDAGLLGPENHLCD